MELLLFSVLASTTEDPESQSDPLCLLPYAKGWRTEKFAKSWPQELILCMNDANHVAVSELRVQ